MKGGMTLYHIGYVDVGKTLYLPSIVGVIGCDRLSNS
jgi:hypothetical protein